MKKEIFMVSMFCLILVLFTCGCTQQENGGTNSGTTTGKTYTMTAKEVEIDMITESDYSTYMIFLYATLEDGDTLIIHDTIDNISYVSETDITKVTFDTSEDGDMSSSLNYPFEGDITSSYQVGDEVKITVTIKYVHETYEFLGSPWDFEIELFEENWTNMHDFINNYSGLPLTSIIKV